MGCTTERVQLICGFYFWEGVEKMIKINGAAADKYEGQTVAQALTDLGYKTKFIAVEYNGEILPKSCYGDTHIKQGDVIEVVNFVGGG